MEGWIKLHRKFLKWEWFDDSKMIKFFIYCLLRANYEDAKWQGQIIKRGSFISSLKNISIDTNFSVQQVRTLISKLKSTHEITSKSTNSYTLITICNFESYQVENIVEQQANQQANQQTDNKRITNEQQTDNKRITTSKNIKKNKNKKKRESTLANFSEEEIKIYNKFLSWSEENIPNVSKMQKTLSIDEYFKIKNSFPSQFIITLLYKMDNYKDMKKKNVSTYRTFLNWAEREQIKK